MFNAAAHSMMTVRLQKPDKIKSFPENVNFLFYLRRGRTQLAFAVIIAGP